MASNDSLSTSNSARNNQIYSKPYCSLCNCEWEMKIAHGLAVSLAILEAKRLFLLALEMIVESAVLLFSGGIKPLIFSFVDGFLGFPCALAVVYSIRKRQNQPCYSKVKILMKYVGLIIVMCAVLNMATLASIGYHVSVRQRTVTNVFNTSMHLYVTTDSYKINLDQIQIEFQCCGHTSYADWFFFDWQRVDYATTEVMDNDRGVPFSCCKYNSLLPCIHVQMSEADVKTINVHGCSKILNQVLIRIVVFGYIMTSMLIITQGILLYFIAKIAHSPLPQECPSDCSCLSSEDSSPRCRLMESTSTCSCSSRISFRRRRKTTSGSKKKF
ncbi:peripherin-2-like isoform X3 [Belonocnema kinseyi]|uniref:peripherin-2-like isoform X3 n=1 Tax=Belonocnema kinseyi TaxID=2817044 RepID=UPI00143D92B4|nr:peripherin-2-like isoform X3 [Belonocnema kinseyi]